MHELSSALAADRVIRAYERELVESDWLDSWHIFGYGEDATPADASFGVLVVHDDDIFPPEAGFPTHYHEHMEVIAWVVTGALEHRDLFGGHATARPGQPMRMSAGTGISHSEMNPTRDPARVILMWIVPNESVEPSFEVADVRSALANREMFLVASGVRKAPLHLHQPAAELWAGVLDPTTCVVLPAAPFLHAFVVDGYVTVGEKDADGPIVLAAGDSLRLLNQPARVLRAGHAGATVLVWAMTEPTSWVNPGEIVPARIPLLTP